MVIIRMQIVSVVFVWASSTALLVAAGAAVAAAAPCFPAVFVFGDSLSDTGNGNLTGNFFFTRTAQKPYGQTFPGHPFTRFSDGHLLVDFLASYIGLQLIKPSLDSSSNFSMGSNYAVSGATAQNTSFLNSKLIFPLTSLSLDVQVGWHLALKASGLGPNKPSTNAYTNGLYVLEIGGNDYIGALQSLYAPSYINTTFVPLVIAKTRNATEVLYANGARHFVFFSITPLGCSPSLLSTFLLDAKDNNGCLKEINSLSYNHGVQLLKLVQDLRMTHQDATFAFVDYYGAYTQVIQNSASYGFLDTLDACCGAGPTFPNKYNLLFFCNTLSSTALFTLCPNPNVYLNWDGIHFTDRFNSYIFNLTIETGSYLNPSNAFSTCSPNTS